jgi:dihydrofolate reductase
MSHLDNVFIIMSAVAKNGIIGKNGGLPWHYPEDLRRFKYNTSDRGEIRKIVVMGSKTYDSLGPLKLPGRKKIVITSRPFPYKLEDTRNYHTIDAFLDTLDFYGVVNKHILIIGGAAIYSQFLVKGLVDFLCITHIDKEYNGDTIFPIDIYGAQSGETNSPDWTARTSLILDDDCHQVWYSRNTPRKELDTTARIARDLVYTSY